MQTKQVIGEIQQEQSTVKIAKTRQDMIQL